MKILQITNKVPVPPKDGGSIASLRLAEGLAKLGHQVLTLALNTSKHFVPDEVVREFERPNHTIKTVPIDTSIQPAKALANLLFSKMPYNAVRFISNDFSRALKTVITDFIPDLIIIENLYPAVYIEDIRKLSKAKIAYRAHNVEHEIWQRNAQNSTGLKKWYLSLLAGRISNFEIGFLNSYDILIPITGRDAEALNLLGNNKPCHVLPAGYTGKSVNNMELDLSMPVLAHLGALDWLPNQEGLLWFVEKVWPLLKKEIPDIKFHLAGRNAPRWLEKRMNRQGIIYHGEIGNAGEFLGSFPIHVVPLFSGSGMRIKIVEAMAHGRVVVTTSIGTEGIEAQHNKNIIIADTPESFSSEILKVLSDEQKCREIGKNAFTFVAERLDNEILVKGFIKFLNNTI